MAHTHGSGGDRQDRGYLGPALEHWRDGVSAVDVVQALDQRGFEITADEYAKVEAGVSRPARLADFLGAVAAHYGLDPTARGDLTTRAAYDILLGRLGKYAALVMPEPTADYPLAHEADPGMMPPADDHE